MKFGLILLPLLALATLSGCTSKNEVNVVKSYKAVKEYKTINIVKGKQQFGSLDENLLNKFEDILFDDLYTQKNAPNFTPGDQLRLTYEIVNIQQLQRNFADWQTYFGKDCNRFEVLFTVYDRYGQEIGMYDVDLEVEYWLFPTDAMVLNSAFETAAYAVSQYLKLNYLAQ